MKDVTLLNASLVFVEIFVQVTSNCNGFQTSQRRTSVWVLKPLRLEATVTQSFLQF